MHGRRYVSQYKGSAQKFEVLLFRPAIFKYLSQASVIHPCGCLMTDWTHICLTGMMNHGMPWTPGDIYKKLKMLGRYVTVHVRQI